MRFLLTLPALSMLVPVMASAEEMVTRTQTSVGTGGVSALWVLANISYAGMRAQGSRSVGWRIVAFIFGFPGTLITFLVVRNGGERAYGIELPRKSLY